MHDYAAALPRAVPSRTIWLVVAPLIAAAGAHLVTWLRARAGAAPALRRAENAETARLVGAASLGLAAGAFVGHALVLARGGPLRRALVESLGSGVRVGQIETGLRFCFDPVAAVFGGAAVLVAAIVAAVIAARPPEERSGVVWARLELALAGVLVTSLADDVPTMAVGWVMACGVAAWLAGRASAAAGVRTSVRAAVGVAALLVGGAWLSSGLGAALIGDEGAPDDRPATGVVPLGGAGDGGSLRMVSFPGTAVYLDDAATPLAVSPFAAAHVAPGRHELRLHFGPGSVDEPVEISMPPDGPTLALVPLGPTLSFRDLGAGLAAAAPALRVSKEEEAGGASVVTGVFCAWAIAALAVAGAAPAPRRRTDLLAQLATAAPLALVLLARAAVLTPFVPRAGWITLAAVVLAIAIAADRRVIPGTLEDATWRAGRLLVRFEHWVLDAVSAAAGAALWALAWIAAWVDAHAVLAPVDAVAVRIGRAGDRLEPAVGGSFAPVAWVLLACAAAALAAFSIAASR
jgi:hypothetical protein